MANKKISSMEFDVIITETSQMRVFVSAKSRCEAERIAYKNWCEADYVFENERHFKNVELEAIPIKLKCLRKIKKFKPSN